MWAKIRENIQFSGFMDLGIMSRGLWSKCGYSQIVFCTISSLHISSAPRSLSHILGCWPSTVLPFYSLDLNFDKSPLRYYNLTLHPAQSSPPSEDLPDLSPLTIPPVYTLVTMHRTRHFGLENWMGQLFSGHMDITFVPESRGKQTIWITKHTPNLPSQGSHAKNE